MKTIERVRGVIHKKQRSKRQNTDEPTERVAKTEIDGEIRGK